MFTYRELLKYGEEKLAEPNVLRVFLLELLREKGKELFLLMDEKASIEIEEDYLQGLKRLMNEEPLAHVLGYQWFYDAKIFVNSDVLIPRPETEELVNNILMDVDENFDKPEIVDVATGSGAIAIVLARELGFGVDASDISGKALEVAKRNAEYNDADVNFYVGDMLEPIIELNKKYDVLVCNPPYIKENENLDPSVVDFEPHVALFGGDDGLYFYRKVFDKANDVLKDKSMMAFEIGFDIGESLMDLAKKKFPKAHIELKQDIHNLNRMLFIYKGINRKD